VAISGMGVAVVTAGSLLVYAGLTKQNPLAALRAVGTGHPAPIGSSSSYQATQGGTSAAGGAVGGTVADVGGLIAQGSAVGGLPQLVGAVEQFSGDRYSQARRWDAGFSDCSSFVGKGFRALGITPPGASVTGSYLAWSKLRQVPRARLQAGDLVCNATHVIVATSNAYGIGQENPRRNVATGPVETLMAGTGSFVCLRYVG
jgi:cell wall-associated NlpC family hydrolase